jgi:hypothetical protein
MSTFVPGQNKVSFPVLTDVVHQNTGNFSGIMPTTDLTTSPHRLEWATGDGGLIDLAQLGVQSAVRVVDVVLMMAGQSTWALTLVDGTKSASLASGTTETTYANQGLAFLTPSQKLKLVTTGGGTTSIKMVVRLLDVNSPTQSVR